MQGLIESVRTWLRQAEHRHCTRHLYANFKRKWSGLEYKSLFWGAATSTIEQAFTRRINAIKDLDAEAFQYLIKREPARWCKAFFETGGSCASFENGISEAFNGQILHARGKPIISMLEDIRVYIMQRYWNMSKLAAELDDNITPSIRKQMNELKLQMRKWQVLPSLYQVVEVRKKDEAFGVNLVNRTCDCKLWNISGVPCVHAVAAYMHFKMDPDDGVSSWYSQSKWFDAYQFSINPVLGSKNWKPTQNTPPPPPLPPVVKRMPGRPRKNKIPHPTEYVNVHSVSKAGRVMTCQNCYQPGHNKASCKNPRQPKTNAMRPPRAPKPTVGESSKQGEARGAIKEEW